jgi:AraC family transcriptional regulator
LEEDPPEGGLAPKNQPASGEAPDVPLEHVLLSSSGRGWNGVDAAEINHPQDDFETPAIPRHVVVVNLGSPFDAKEKLQGREGYLDSGGLVVLPAGAPREWHLARQGQVRHLHLYLDPALLRDVAVGAGLDLDNAELVETLGVRDPQIEHAAMSLLSELRSGDLLGGRIYVESLANVLAVSLLRRYSSLGYSSVRKLEHERAGGLPEASLRTALAYVGDNLAEDLGLAEIAREVHMSPYHFSRMFKLSTGLSPHQYVIRQRIERAKALLTNTDLPVGVVAQEAGFASPSHFAQQFRRLVGVSPRSFRWDLSQKSKKPTKDRKDSEAGWPAGSDTDSRLSNKPTQGRQQPT